MKVLLNLGLLSLAVSAMAAGHFSAETTGRTLLETPNNHTRTDSIYFSEDFENGMNGWEAVDMTAMAPVWHASEFMSLDGNAWWSGLEALGGYDNHWLQYLDTPTITVTSDGTFSFDLHVAVEGAAGASAPYDGWDGCNVWMQVDGGDWQVAEGFSLPYTVSSLYSFGFEFGMGEGIPGWTDVIDWQNVTFDLQDYVGNDLAFRFAFCSDPAYATPSDAGIYGMMVDNIVLECGGEILLDNDADGTEVPAPLVASSGGEPAGSTWALSDADSHTGSYSMNGGPGYSLSNAVVSPVYSLPEGLDMWLEFWILSDLLDAAGGGGSTLEDYYYVEVSTNGVAWETMFYDYTDPERPGSNGEWEDFVPGLPFNNNMEMSLNAYAGMDIQLRFRMTTDDNDDGGSGTGIWVDDVEIWGSDVPANDLAVTKIVPSYPRTEGMDSEVFVEVTNFGSEDRLQVLAWLKANEEMVGPCLPRMDIPGLSIGSSSAVWTPELVGENELMAYATNPDDQNNSNDTLWVSPIDVLPAGEMLFGYSYVDPAFYFSAGDPAMFVELDYETIDFSLTEIQLGLYDPDGNAGGKVIRIHVMNDADGMPADEFYTEDFTLTTQDALTFWTFPLAGDVNVTGNFWVWCERLEDYPHALGADFMWNGGHYAITDGIDYDLSFNAEGGNELMFFAKGEGTVGVNDAPAMPSAYKLEAAYPNPFNPVTTIAFTAPAGEMASLKVYNLNGQLVSTLFEGETMGHTQVQFDASALASGVYFARLSTQSGFTSAQKLVLVK
jgi:hypothetical protein